MLGNKVLLLIKRSLLMLLVVLLHPRLPPRIMVLVTMMKGVVEVKGTWSESWRSWKRMSTSYVFFFF